VDWFANATELANAAAQTKHEKHRATCAAEETFRRGPAGNDLVVFSPGLVDPALSAAQPDIHLILPACTYEEKQSFQVNSVLMTGHTDDGLVPASTLKATKLIFPPDQWTKKRQNKSWLSILRRPPAQRKPHPSRSMFVVRVLSRGSVIFSSDTLQNASYTLGITTRPFLSGQDFASSQFFPMRSKPSRRLSWCIRSSKRGIQSCVMNHFTFLTRCRCMYSSEDHQRSSKSNGVA